MTEQDKLEQFIREHRAGFDGEEPGARVWAGLEKEIAASPAPRIVRLFRQPGLKAAVFLLLLGSVFMAFLINSADKPGRRQINISPELAEMQSYYTRKIETKLSYIRSLPSGKTGLTPESLQGLELNNPAYRQLQQALQENPGDQRVRAAFIQYYRSKLEVLDRITTTINNIQQENENGHEKTNSI